MLGDSILYGPWFCDDISLDLIVYMWMNNKEGDSMEESNHVLNGCIFVNCGLGKKERLCS